MHPASAFLQTDAAALAALARARPLAVVIGVRSGRPVIAHAPVLLDDARLRFHLSAANPVAAAIAEAGRALAVLTGPDAYVSPDWYGLPDQVPTWNYLAIEIEGPTLPLDSEGAAALLDDLSARFEAPLIPKPVWTRTKMTPGRFESLLAGIIAFEMRIERIEGTWKLSQNKPAEAIRRTAEALAERPEAGAQEISAAMLSRLAAD